MMSIIIRFRLTFLSLVIFLPVLATPVRPLCCDGGQNPDTALLISVVPGFFLHGLGHAYAGRYWTAGGLMLAEAAGIALLLSSGVGLAFGDSIGSLDDDEAKKVDALIGAGNLLFWGSWLYDIIAPQVLLRGRSKVALLPDPGGGVSVKFTRSF